MPDRPILIVDDDSSQRRLIEFWLQEEGYSTVAAADGQAGLQLFEQTSPRLVITDLRMPGIDGLDLLSRIKGVDQNTPVILITAFGTVANAVDAMKLGAADYILKPLNPEELKLSVDRALERQQLVAENQYLRDFAETAFRFENLVGNSRKMREVFRSEELKLSVDRALERQQLVAENQYLRDFAETAFRFENLVGNSRKMREVF